MSRITDDRGCCLMCGQPVERKGRVCSKCSKPITRRHKWRIVGGRVEHKNCQCPERISGDSTSVETVEPSDRRDLGKMIDGQSGGEI